MTQHSVWYGVVHVGSAKFLDVPFGTGGALGGSEPLQTHIPGS